MRFGVLLATATCLVVAATASAHRGAPTWTEATATRMVARDATVRLPRDTAARVEEGLWNEVVRYRLLEQLARAEDDQQAAARFHDLSYRLSTVLEKIEGGLPIAAADCDGVGAASRGHRFKHFRCMVGSGILVIPEAELVYDDPDDLPTLVEGVPRRQGPYAAVLEVHMSKAPRRSTASKETRDRSATGVHARLRAAASSLCGRPASRAR